MNLLHNYTIIVSIVLMVVCGYCQRPPYPITAAEFEIRHTLDDCTHSLKEFGSIGGETVILKSNELLLISFDKLKTDPNFKYCGTSNGSQDNCIIETQNQFNKAGINTTFAVYKNGNGLTNKAFKCPKYDRIMGETKDGLIYRLVIPLIASRPTKCGFKKGDGIMAIFSIQKPRDSQRLLLQSATKLNMSVYFGLPRITPKIHATDASFAIYMTAYEEFVKRIVQSSALNYSKSIRTKYPFEHEKPLAGNISDTLKGYYFGDDVLLGDLAAINPIYLNAIKQLSTIIHSFGKKVLLATSIDLRKHKNFTVNDHVSGFERLANTSTADVIIVSEGRGTGKGCYYYTNQQNESIKALDPVLFEILKTQFPNLQDNSTFAEMYVGSNNALFKQLGESRDRINGGGNPFDFWLNIEAFENISSKADSCKSAFSTDAPFARTTKSRVDRALTVAGAQPQKIMATAWDPYFTCKSEGFNTSLAEDILHDMSRTIVSYCGWHSKANMSLVLIGFNVGGHCKVDYYIREGTQQNATVYGYYFETDWGLYHQRVPSLIYTQTSNVMDPYDVSMNGTVSILPDDAYNDCEFAYDYR